jgi:hypothetical protein
VDVDQLLTVVCALLDPEGAPTREPADAEEAVVPPTDD